MYYIDTKKENILPSRVKELLEQSYWANNRSLNAVSKSLENSLLYGVFEKRTNILVGFARVITDYATTWYLCDVIVDEPHRGNGIGKMLMDYIVHDPQIANVTGMLLTRDAHGLYKKFGFESIEGIYMGYKR